MFVFLNLYDLAYDENANQVLQKWTLGSELDDTKVADYATRQIDSYKIGFISLF